MASSREMLSVGIDVGTTTTMVVFSRLLVRDVARLGAMPRLEVDQRAVIHAGPPNLTPLLEDGEIDVASLVDLVRKEYADAGVDPDEVETGAIIVTGETARATNAAEILQALSGLAGDFVVTVAGPGLEGQIAGRGSGAAAWSVDHYTQVTNVDVGGGSANAAVFLLGALQSAAAIEVGGRLVRLDGDGTVTHVAPPGRVIAEAHGIPLQPGSRASMADLRRLCEVMATMIVDLVTGAPAPTLPGVALTVGLQLDQPSTAVFVSGGVGWCLHEHAPATTLAEVATFGDLGPLLAVALRDEPRLSAMQVLRPTDDLRATVLGAASQTVTLSGSTIWADPGLLPLRNLPVVQPRFGPTAAVPAMTAAIRRAVAHWDVADQVVAIALDMPWQVGFAELTSVTDAVLDAATPDLPPGAPLVLVLHHDVAKALGQTINGRRPDLPLVAIDQIGLGEGDFIDIGTPILDGRVVPVSVKTLVFTT